MASDQNEVALKIIFNDLSGNRIEVDRGLFSIKKIRLFHFFEQFGHQVDRVDFCLSLLC